ncbi:MAG: ABC transporter substrate-binding protein [Firmicutes bacterium]|nr:ABC transporter substrate-binding protein [Bacillota bacterium]
MVKAKNAIAHCLALVLVFSLVLGQLACAPSVQAASKRITITDSLGRTVRVPYAPQRIIVTNSDTAEMICALGAANYLVGVSDTCLKDPLLKPKLKKAQDVGKWNAPNVEKIVALRPDIVFGYPGYTKDEVIVKLQKAGIPVVLLDCYKWKTLAQDIRTLGKILGKEKQAAEYIAVIEKYQKLIEGRTKKLPLAKKPSTYVESYTDYSSVSAGSGGAQMLEAAGGKNIAGGFRIPYPKVSPEWVLAQNPQVIIKAVSSTSVPSGLGESAEAMKKKRAEIMSRPGWKKISAVQKGRVYIVSSDIWTGPRAVVGIAYMAKWIHPGLFRDLDPAAIHKEILKKFHGVEPKGAWVYP